MFYCMVDVNNSYLLHLKSIQISYLYVIAKPQTLTIVMYFSWVKVTNSSVSVVVGCQQFVLV